MLTQQTTIINKINNDHKVILMVIAVEYEHLLNEIILESKHLIYLICE